MEEFIDKKVKEIKEIHNIELVNTKLLEGIKERYFFIGHTYKRGDFITFGIEFNTEEEFNTEIEKNIEEIKKY